MLLGGAAATLTVGPVGAQTAQNEPGAISAAAPRAGAPMSFADLAAQLQPAVVNISTRQTHPGQPHPPGAARLRGILPPLRRAGSRRRRRRARHAARRLARLRLHHLGRRLCRHQQPCRLAGPNRRHRRADHGDALRPPRIRGRAGRPRHRLRSRRAQDQGHQPALRPLRRFDRRPGSATGWWRSAIRSASAAPSPPASSRRFTATSGAGIYDRYIQTDASINMGNSGGPMFDLNGNVIGINTALISPTGGNVGIGFAIPAEQARPIIEALRKRPAPAARLYRRQPAGARRGHRRLARASQEPRRADPRASPPAAPAARAGIQQGDVVVSVAGQPVTPDESLAYLVSRTAGRLARADRD